MTQARAVPVDFLVMEFPIGQVPLAGDLATELLSLEAAELIHILDLAVVEKRADGSVEVIEVDDLGDLGDLARLVGVHSLLGARDVEDIAEVLTAGTTAAVVVWENTWAEDLLRLASECGGGVAVSGSIAIGAPLDHRPT